MPDTASMAANITHRRAPSGRAPNQLWRQSPLARGLWVSILLQRAQSRRSVESKMPALRHGDH
jgi:hypothetical protein